MPSGPKKRKAVRKKKETEANNQPSSEEESSGKTESIDGNTTMPEVDDSLEYSNKENSSPGLPTDRAVSVVGEIDELVGNDDLAQVLNSNKESLVLHEANTTVGKEFSHHIESVVVQENVGAPAVQQNMQARQISQQLEGLKNMVIEELCVAEKTRTTLHELLDGLNKMQQIIVEQ